MEAFKIYSLRFSVWALYFSLEFYIEKLNQIFSKTSIPRYFLGILLFYTCLKIFKISGIFNKICLFIVVLFMFIILSLCLKYETVNLFKKLSNPPIEIQLLYIIDNFTKLFGAAYVLSIYSKIVKKHKLAIAFENQLLALENSYLNSKIDTHFFLNSLNIFYARFLKNSNKEAAQKLIEISKFVKNNL